MGKYVKELFANDRDKLPQIELKTGPSILTAKVGKAFRQTKQGKAQNIC